MTSLKGFEAQESEKNQWLINIVSMHCAPKIITLVQPLLIRRQQIRIMEICRQSIKQLQKPALRQQP